MGLSPVFHGADPVLSLLLLGLLALSALLVSWWSYPPTPSFQGWKRILLILLRGSALFLLLLLLINPYRLSGERTAREPVLAVYLDNSLSMGVNRGSWQGADSYNNLLGELGLERLKTNVRYFRFDGGVEPVSGPDLDLTGSSTRLDEVTAHLERQPEEVRAAIVISDGIITRGRDPLFDASGLRVPLFSIAAGDSSRLRDVAISRVDTDPDGTIHTLHPVEVTIRQEGFGGEQTEVKLVRVDADAEAVRVDAARVDADADAARLDADAADSETSAEIRFDQDLSQQTVRFYLNLQEAGVQTWQIRIPPLEGEESVENNSWTFTVDVKDKKLQIWHLAFEIHPDAGFLRSLIEADPDLLLHPGTWTGTRFLEGDLPEPSSDDAGLLVLHGPLPDRPGLVPESLRSLPQLWIATPGSRPGEITGTIPGMEVSSGNPSVDLWLREEAARRDHPVLEPLGIPASSAFPALHSSVRITGVSEPAQRLLHAAPFRSSEQWPVLVTEETPEQRRALLSAWGWYRAGLSPDPVVRDFAHSLIGNLIRWTATSPGVEKLQIGLNKSGFSEGEEMRFSGTLISETGRPETSASVTVIITGEQNLPVRHPLRHEGEGVYRLTLPAPSAGSWSYELEAVKEGRTIGRDSGEFTVVPSTREYASTQRDDRLLRDLAEATGGEFLAGEVAGRIGELLEERGLLEPLFEEVSSRNFLYRWPGWFLIILMILSAEWLLRRRYSLL